MKYLVSPFIEIVKIHFIYFKKSQYFGKIATSLIPRVRSLLIDEGINDFCFQKRLFLQLWIGYSFV